MDRESWYDYDVKTKWNLFSKKEKRLDYLHKTALFLTSNYV